MDLQRGLAHNWRRPCLPHPPKMRHIVRDNRPIVHRLRLMVRLMQLPHRCAEEVVLIRLRHDLCVKRRTRLSFRCVCPEPVLANRRDLLAKGEKGGVSHLRTCSF